MPNSSQEFKHETMQDPQAVVGYLKALGEGLASGRIVFAAGDHELAVEPKGLIRFMIKAQREDGRVRITARMSWKERDLVHSGSVDASSQPLSIQTQGAQV